jgi:L-ascorbate metabolism protein UlaG (beta-lactamase superfamily)
LGQAGFALRVEDQVLLVDPYLSDTLAAKYAGTVFPHTRLHPSPVAARRLRGVVGVLHTHAHTDHMDPGTIGALRDRLTATFVAPRARRSTALDRGIPEAGLVAVDAGETVTIGRFTITALPAAHEELTRDEDGAHHFLGYVIDTGTVRIYHSGDCVPYPGQVELLSMLRVDLALLPINGRDAHRLANGVPGNFFLEEAVRLCRAAGIPALIGHHFGLFDFNTITPAHAVDELTATASSLEWTVPAVGAGFRLNRPAPATSPEEPR